MRQFWRGVAVTVLMLGVAGCWPAPNQGPDRSGYNPVETAITPATAPTLAPRWQAAGVPTQAFVTDGGTIYTRGGGIAAVDAATGAVRWVHRFNWRLSTTGVFVDGGDVLLAVSLVGSSTDRYDPATGAVSDHPGDGGVTALRGRHELLTDGVPAPDYQTGTTFVEVVDRDDPAAGWRGALWHGPIAVPRAWPTTTLGAERVYGAGDGLLATAPGDATHGTGVRAFPVAGARLDCGVPEGPAFACPTWVTPVAGGSLTTPVLAPGEGAVIVGSDTGVVHALDTATGAPLWTADVGAAVAAEPALADGVLYVPTADGRVVAFATAACAAAGPGAGPCAPSWEAELGAAAIADQPAVAGGVVAAATADGRLAAYDAAGCGAPACPALWSDDLATPVGAGPVVTGGRLLVGTTDGTLHAYAPAPGPGAGAGGP